MGQIANQMALELIYKIKDKIAGKKQEKDEKTDGKEVKHKDDKS